MSISFDAAPSAFKRVVADTAVNQILSEAETLISAFAHITVQEGDKAAVLKATIARFGALNKRVQALTMRDLWHHDFSDGVEELQDGFGYYTRLPTYLRAGGADVNYQSIIQQIIAQLEDNERLNVEVLKSGFVKLTVSTADTVRDVSPNQFYVVRDVLDAYLSTHSEKCELVDGRMQYDANRPGLQQELNTIHPFFIEVDHALSVYGEDPKFRGGIIATMVVIDLSGEDRKDRRLEIALHVPDAVQASFTRDPAIETATDDQVYQRQRIAWCVEQTLDALHAHFPTRRYVCTEATDEDTGETYYI